MSRLRASNAIRSYHTRFRIFADDRLEVSPNLFGRGAQSEP